MGNCLQCGGMLNLNINLDEELRYFLCPKRDAALLQEEMNALRSSKEGVEEMISVLERDPCKRVLPEVKHWIESVNEHDKEVRQILGSLNRSNNNNGSSSSSGFRGLCRCCFCTNHSLGVKVKNELQVVRLLKGQTENWGGSDKLAVDVPLQYNRRLSERLGGNNIDSGAIVGIEETMSRVFKCLKDDKVVVIGIHGMGGAGKTTLINQVINRLHSSSAEEEPIVKFESIIPVVVSQKLDVRKIQDEIAKQLGIDLSRHGDDERDRAGVLSAWLSRRRFLLVLDDVWEAVDLKRIVGNLNNNGCSYKVVLTTRDESVCVGMGCQERVKVGCLGKEHSWELFQKTIRRDDDWFQSVIGIREIAEEIVRRCGGLPLLLITIARVMATKSDIQGWKYAKEALKDSPHDIRGMEDVYGLLEFSFNNLKNEEYKSCLLYSALFREDYHIPIEQMVDYCIGGGSIVGADSSSGSSDINRLRDKGAFIISELVDACLLERVEGLERYVKVHDAIRDMILRWLGEGDKEQPNRRILSLAGKGREGVFNIDEILQRDVSKVSLADNNIREVVVGHENDVQVLLLCRNRNLGNLPRSLFEYFPNLRVLDLSQTPLREIPASLCLLKSLQYLNMSYTFLEQMPASLCSLKSLQYLNLSGTDIEALPKEMGNLMNLMQLDLYATRRLCEIPRGVLSSLSKLQSMNLIECGFFCRPVGKEKLEVLKEVDSLPLLKDVGLFLWGDLDAVKFIVDESNMLSISITELQIGGVDLVSCGLFQRIGSRSTKPECLHIHNFLEEDKEEELVIDEGHFMQLKSLIIRKTYSLQRIIIVNKGRVLEQLTYLKIEFCHGLRDLACLWQLPNLKSLIINHCYGMVEVVPPQPGGDGNHSHGINYRHEPLQKLQYIRLWLMKSLVRISSSPLSLHSLTCLWIENCRYLKELSIVPSNSRNVEIKCQQRWWEGLKWEDGAPPPNLNPFFFYPSFEYF